MRTSGAAASYYALQLGVNVEHGFATELCCIKELSSVHTGLLVNGKNGLYWRMRNGIRIKNGKCHCYGNTVICAKARSLCPKVLAVGLEVKSILFEVFQTVSSLDCNHVKMTLENYRLVRFIAARGIFIYDDIAELIAAIIKTSLPCKLAAKLGYLRCVIRAVRN